MIQCYISQFIIIIIIILPQAGVILYMRSANERQR